MSVDGVIISDLRRALSEAKPVPFFFLICGPTGSGKSATLRAVRDGAAAHGMRIIHGAPVAEDAALGPEERHNATVRIFSVDYHALRSMDTRDASVFEDYLPGTVVFLDDIEALDYLLRLHALSHRLEAMVRRLLRSPRCTLVTSAVDVHHVPRWLMDIWAPVTYQLQELTPTAARRYLCSLQDGDDYTSCLAGENAGTLLSCLRTQRALTMALCHARFACPAPQCTISPASLSFLGQTSTLPRPASNNVRLFGLESVAERIQALVKLFLKREDLAGRDTLAAAASTTGILLHGPSGSGKTALAARLEALCHGRFFFVSCAALFSKYLGESEERLRDAFFEARCRAPSVLILDDVDVIGASRGSFSDSGRGDTLDVTRRMLAALLCELDGLSDNRRVLVIATTNTPDTLDGALLRQGRFETLVHVPPLSFEAAREMALDFFSAFDGAEVEAQDRLSRLVAAHAEGCDAASLKLFLRVLLERQLRREGTADGSTFSLPMEEFVHAAIRETGALQRAEYKFSKSL